MLNRFTVDNQLHRGDRRDKKEARGVAGELLLSVQLQILHGHCQG